jgi:hypothetical protein
MAERVEQAYIDHARAVTDAQPMLVVLEDLHWGDAPSVRIFDRALRELCDRPFVVIAFARPEVHDLFPRLWMERGRSEIQLRPLPARAAEFLVRSALGEAIDAQTVAAVVARADGNAFYLEELIRAVAEGRGGALPETVLGMVEARLAALGSEERRLLRAASVFGEVCCKGETISTRKNNAELFRAVICCARHGRGLAGGRRGGCTRAIGARRCGPGDRGSSGARFGACCAWGRSYGGAEPGAGSFRRAPLRRPKAGLPSRVRRARSSPVATRTRERHRAVPGA